MLASGNGPWPCSHSRSRPIGPRLVAREGAGPLGQEFGNSGCWRGLEACHGSWPKIYVTAPGLLTAVRWRQASGHLMEATLLSLIIVAKASGSARQSSLAWAQFGGPLGEGARSWSPRRGGVTGQASTPGRRHGRPVALKGPSAQAQIRVIGHRSSRRARRFLRLGDALVRARSVPAGGPGFLAPPRRGPFVRRHRVAP